MTMTQNVAVIKEETAPAGRRTQNVESHATIWSRKPP